MRIISPSSPTSQELPVLLLLGELVELSPSSSSFLQPANATQASSGSVAILDKAMDHLRGQDSPREGARPTPWDGRAAGCAHGQRATQSGLGLPSVAADECFAPEGKSMAMARPCHNADVQ